MESLDVSENCLVDGNIVMSQSLSFDTMAPKKSLRLPPSPKNFDQKKLRES
jgi:hypothetical protein